MKTKITRFYAAGKNPNPEVLAKLEYWIRERHLAYRRRKVLMQPPPWTEDPVVEGTFFCNVYRELDEGTKWLVAHVAENTSPAPNEEQQLDAIFNALVYRMALNEQSKAALGWLMITGFESGKIRETLRKFKGQVFTPAYMVRSNAGSKIDSICDSYLRIADTLDQRRDEILNVPGRKEFVEWCARNLHGIGPFVAFQALVDLCYPEIKALPWDNDGWACTGPGSQKGLTLIYGGYELADERMEWLTRHLNEHLEGDMLGWGPSDPFVPLTRANVQNSLCELSKYMRALEGKGTKRRFTPRDSWLRDRESCGHGRQLELLHE